MIDPTTPQFAKFMATLAEQLRKAHDANPTAYIWTLPDLPRVTAQFAQGLTENPRTVSIKGPAMRETCKALGILRTYKAIEAYLKGEV